MSRVAADWTRPPLPVHDAGGRKRRALVQHIDGLVELHVHARTHSAPRRCAVHSHDVFRLLAVLAGSHETLRCALGQSNITGQVIVRDIHGAPLLVELRIARRYAKGSVSFYVDDDARAMLRTQIARAVGAASATPAAALAGDDT